MIYSELKLEFYHPLKKINLEFYPGPATHFLPLKFGFSSLYIGHEEIESVDNEDISDGADIRGGRDQGKF